MALCWRKDCKPAEAGYIVPTALINSGMTMFYQYIVPDGTRMIEMKRNQFFGWHIPGRLEIYE
ncbi:MAG TPA: hypothetical protein VMV77_04035 [Bacteroidales bacterium]|nr:hypothetical protein [Bacteroidales bacterium]